MNDQQRTITLRLILQMLLVIVVAPFLPLLIAGRWGWWEALAYVIPEGYRDYARRVPYRLLPGVR